MVDKVVKSAESTENRLETLESKLDKCLSVNAKLNERLEYLEGEHSRSTNVQRQLTEENSKKINSLEVDLGFTNRNMFDCWAETKERKIVISGIAESNGEDVKTTALNAINRVVSSALALKNPETSLTGLRKLKAREIDNVYRIGKFHRNISVTFLTVDDKDMIIKAKSALKNDQDIKFFFNDDISNDGSTLKTKLKRIAQVAKSQGREAKASGNKVTIGPRTYFSNELDLIPSDVSENLKQEREIDGGIIYKGEKSILSNFYPAPFNLNGVDYLHVEQYYQHLKALHHHEFQMADSIMRLSNPRRIKSAGDGIESNAEWLDKRMMTLYQGVKAKFEQNWALQDGLIATSGKQLYEATTDLYFACGLSYESKKWAEHNWVGENVAGLILMKVQQNYQALSLVPIHRIPRLASWSRKKIWVAMYP